MNKLSLIFIIISTGFLSEIFSQVDTIQNVYFTNNTAISRNKLILLPTMKGGAGNAYLFEFDNNSLGLIFYTWTFRERPEPDVTRAYVWKAHRWKKVECNLNRINVEKFRSHSAFYGDFDKLDNICIYYEGKSYNDAAMAESFKNLTSKYGLDVEVISRSNYHKRSFRIKVLLFYR